MEVLERDYVLHLRFVHGNEVRFQARTGAILSMKGFDNCARKGSTVAVNKKLINRDLNMKKRFYSNAFL